jgi:hypothetical protein
MRRAMLTLSRAGALLLLTAQVADAHAIHTTVTQFNTDGQAISLTIRAFADDISATVARAAGRPAPTDFALAQPEVTRYVQSRFQILNGSQSVPALEACGITRTGDMYWLCFRTRVPAGARALSIRNAVLTELHADQINIVQVVDRGARQTLLFRKGSAPAALASRP